ncbi:hypothetical protein DITRI_Ditri02bG0179900 [Diplodiscus trichospermus]
MYNNLTGHIPSNTFDYLSKLKGFYLSVNQLSGRIPTGLFKCQELEELFLSVNYLLEGIIPAEIGNLTMLKNLYLGSNVLKGKIPPEMGNLLSLEELSLQNCHLIGSIPSVLANLTLLRILELSDNILTGNSFSGYIPNDLGNLRDLQWLNLVENNLSSKPSSSELSFPSSLTNCKQLEFLALDTNPLISGKLPISIGNLSNIQEFIAYGCNIRGSIPEEIGNASNLFWLDLDSNWKSLAFLHLTGNRLGGQIPACLGYLVSLRNLFLGSNKFVNSIPSNLTRLTDILRLNFSSNSLNGALPIDVGKWKAITSIDFSKNQLSGEIPKSIGDLKDLTNLSLSGNNSKGLYESFGSLIGLQVLDLSRNNFSGIIPKSLEKLLYLEYFNASFNRLDGEIPDGGPFANYSIRSFMGNKALCATPRLRLPLPPCKDNSIRKHSRKAIKLVKYILLPVGSTNFLLALILILSKRRKRNRPNDQENLQALAEWRRVSYQDLHQATDGFSDSKLLGVGSFGLVYHGTLSDGSSIAVKVFNLELEGAFKSFDIECEVLLNIRHRNLVKIISSCSNIDFKALVLEFMPSGSLEKWLYSHNLFLDILLRLNITIDVASALEYLHHGYTTPVINCDLKPNNILLNEDIVAHLGDFGIAKLLGNGYMAPETFTRKKPTDEIFSEERSMKFWVQESLPSALNKIVDPNLLNINGERRYLATRYCASSILQLALECSKEVPVERIDMKEVVAKLKKIKLMFLQEINRRA